MEEEQKGKKVEEKKTENKEVKLNKKQPTYIKAKERTAHMQKKLETDRKSLKAAKKDHEAPEGEIKALEDELAEIEKNQQNLEEELAEESKSNGRDLTLQDSQVEEYNRLKEAEKLSSRYSQELDSVNKEQKSDQDRCDNEIHKKAEVESEIKQKRAELEENVQRLETEKITEYIKTIETSLEDLKVQEKEMKEVEEAKKRVADINEELISIMNELVDAKVDKHEDFRQRRKAKIVDHLKRLFPGVYDRLVNMCQPIHKRYNVAITRVLEKNMEAIVVDTERTALSCIQYLKKQKLEPETFLSLDNIDAKPLKERLRNIHQPKNVKLLYDVLQYDPPAIERAILYATNNALVCETAEDAYKVAYKLGDNKRYDAVALDGTYHQKKGLFSCCSPDLVKRTRRWDEKALHNLKCRKEKLTEELKEMMKKTRKESDLTTIMSQIRELETHLKYLITDKDNTIEMTHKALNNAVNQLDLSRNECANLKDIISSLNTKIQQFSKDMEELQKLNQSYQQTIAGQDEKIEILKNENFELMTQGIFHQATQIAEEVQSAKGKKHKVDAEVNYEKEVMKYIEKPHKKIKADRATRFATVLDKMNPPYNAPVNQAPYMPPYNQPPYGNYNFPAQGGTGAKNSIPYGGISTQNGHINNYVGQLPNQSTSQVQSATVPPNSQMVNNQLSQDLNALHLSQNQNHPLLTNPPHQHSSNSFSEPPASHSPNPNYQPYWQQQPPPRLSQNSGAIYNNPPGHYPPNSSTDNYAAPPSYNAGFMDRTQPPVDKQNQSQKFPSHDMYPPPNQPPPPMSQMNKPPGYTNGTGFAPPTSQYPNSNMQARYPPSSHSPSVAQSNVQSNTNTQFNQGSNAVPPQNRMGALPQPPVQNRRLDPDNMPSPIQVIEDDRKLRSTEFSTAQRGLVPPLVTTNFTVIDEGLCSPRFMRSTIYNVPTTAEMLKQTSVPFALAISPFARLHEDELRPTESSKEIDVLEYGTLKANKATEVLPVEPSEEDNSGQLFKLNPMIDEVILVRCKMTNCKKLVKVEQLRSHVIDFHQITFEKYRRNINLDEEEETFKTNYNQKYRYERISSPPTMAGITENYLNLLSTRQQGDAMVSDEKSDEEVFKNYNDNCWDRSSSLTSAGSNIGINWRKNSKFNIVSFSNPPKFGKRAQPIKNKLSKLKITQPSNMSDKAVGTMLSEKEESKFDVGGKVLLARTKGIDKAMDNPK